MSDCLTSVYHKVSDKTEVGLNTTYNLQTSNVGLGFVGKYTLDDGAMLKVGRGFLINAHQLVVYSYSLSCRPR